MTRIDDELGPMRLCPGCGEEWPDDPEFYRKRYRHCRACMDERKRVRERTDEGRAKDRARKKAIRNDPLRRDAFLAKERVRALRYYHARKGHAA